MWFMFFFLNKFRTNEKKKIVNRFSRFFFLDESGNWVCLNDIEDDTTLYENTYEARCPFRGVFKKKLKFRFSRERWTLFLHLLMWLKNHIIGFFNVYKADTALGNELN